VIDIAVGDELPALVVEPISRTTLALFAGPRATTIRFTSTWT
jgi:hypothetical protein